jgi:hypothetical protein
VLTSAAALKRRKRRIEASEGRKGIKKKGDRGDQELS